MQKSAQPVDYKYPDDWLAIRTIDLHTCGEPLRVIISGLPEIQGSTILEQIQYFKTHYDHIRQGIINEPRGHADMYAAVITPPMSVMPILALSFCIMQDILPCVDTLSLLWSS